MRAGLDTSCSELLSPGLIVSVPNTYVLELNQMVVRVAIFTTGEPGFFPLGTSLPTPELLVCSRVPISPAFRRQRRHSILMGKNRVRNMAFAITCRVADRRICAFRLER